MLAATKRHTLSEKVAENIKEYILDRRLKPGDRLPTEHEMADLFGVSRISVREATKALGFLGIVDAAPRRGIRVGQVDMHRTSDYLGFHLAIADYAPEQLIETRIVLESGALPWLMQNMANDHTVYEQLTELNDRLRRARTLKKRIELDILFHRELVTQSGLHPLVAFSDLLEIFFRRFRKSVQKAEWQEGIESHQRLIDYLRDGRLDDACEELRRHVESHTERI